MELKAISENRLFNGTQTVFSHYSEVCRCDMTFGLFLPSEVLEKTVPLIWFLSGLTCTHENAMTKAGAQQWASANQLAIIFPDTSPRGKHVVDDSSYDLGQGAGFYLDANQSPWSEHFNMDTYIKEELNTLIFRNFEVDQFMQGITGHSMGGLGALNLALKNQDQFRSVSAFSPIANPTESEWGQKQFSAYLGEDPVLWKDYDPSILLKKHGFPTKLLIDQGKDDNFYNLLRPGSLSDQFSANKALGEFRYHNGYDHSYFFISTFIKDHLEHHVKILLD